MSSTQTLIPTATWRIDPVHSSVGFGVKHLGISTFRGTFPVVSGTIETRDGQIVRVAGAAEAASLRTEEPQLTGHLLSGDFLAAEAHPQLRFTSTSVSPLAGDRLCVDGSLEIRGIARPVTLAAEIEGIGEDPSGTTRMGIVAEGAIDRSEWDITFNIPLANGGRAIGERVTLTLHVEAVRND